MKRLNGVVLCVVASSLATAACGGRASEGSDASAQEEASFQASQAELLADSSVSEQQREALSDGEVDLAELESAGLGYEACMRSVGLETRFIIEVSGGYFTEGSVPEGMSVEEFERLENECDIATARVVARQYSFQRRLPADLRQARSEYFEQCLLDSDTPDSRSVEALCWDEAVEANPAG